METSIVETFVGPDVHRKCIHATAFDAAIDDVGSRQGMQLGMGV